MLKVDWLDFKDVRSTRSIDSTFHWPVDSTRLHRQTIDLIGRLDRFRGLQSTNGAITNDLERTLTLFSMSHHSLTLNISQTATDTTIVTIEGK